MFFSIPLCRTLAITSCMALSAQSLLAQEAPLDTKTMLETLRGIKEKQVQQETTSRGKALQDAAAAMGNPQRAAELMEEAYRYTRFEGGSRDSAQFREWKEGDGSALREKEVLSALRLYFSWLSLSLRKAGGASTRDLMPALMTHAQELMADQAAMDVFEDNLKKAREQAQGGAAVTQGARRMSNNPREREKRSNDAAVKQMHDQLLRQPLTGSMYVEWMRLGPLLDDVVPARQAQGRQGGGRQGEPRQPESQQQRNWEGSPGNLDGIYQRVLLPELRAMQDQRAVDYWDTVLRREAEVVGRTKLAFEIDKFNQVRRPQLLWNRAQEWAHIGKANRAATEMFAIIKAFPAHADAKTWVDELEKALTTPTAGAAPAAAAPTAAQ